MTAPLLEARGLVYRYPDGTPGLECVHLELRAGERVALVGANGAGKSTLLLHLSGCLQPDTGVLQLAGRALGAGDLVELRRRVGLVFQDPDDKLFMPSALEDVAYGPLNQGCDPSLSEARALACLGSVGAAHLRDRTPLRLSAGEKRRVAIAAVLALEPDLLVLDEPTTGLDPRGRRALIELLAGLEHGALIATHDLDLVLDLCPRVVVMNAGKIAADGPAADLLSDPALLDACGLERPTRLRPCASCGELPT